MNTESTRHHFLRWFDPRFRSLPGWAFILNRITALGLTLYLFLHLIALGNLARGEEAYDSFIALTHHPLIKLGEMLVIAAGLIHGLNGIRIALTSIGIGIRWQRQMFFGLMLIAVTGTIVFGYKMFFVP